MEVSERSRRVQGFDGSYLNQARSFGREAAGKLPEGSDSIVAEISTEAPVIMGR